MVAISLEHLVMTTALNMQGVNLAYPRERTFITPSSSPSLSPSPSHSSALITLLHDADWSLHSGAQVALCGPSGCGKTSLLNMLAAIEKPTSGTICWDAAELCNMSVRQQDAWRRHQLGLVFQQFHLFPHLSALENVLLPTRFIAIAPSSAQRERAQMLLARVGVRAHADIVLLSRGEQQRVAVARALLTVPRVVLADEPTASVDTDTAQMIAALLRDLCREQGSTLIVATHDRDIASGFDAIYDMKRGKIMLRH